MKKTLLIPALALAAASVALPAAAQSYGHGPSRGGGYQQDYRGWQSINQRQSNLERRIDQGVRYGSITRREAVNLRAEFNQIARLEANYRRGGLTQWERNDLDRRFDRLSAKIRYESRDRDHRRDDRRDGRRY